MSVYNSIETETKRRKLSIVHFYLQKKIDSIYLTMNVVIHLQQYLPSIIGEPGTQEKIRELYGISHALRN